MSLLSRTTLAVAAFAALPFVAQAGTIYTDPAAFQAALSSHYLESFDGIASDLISSPLTFSSGGYSYSVADSEAGLWGLLAPGSSTDMVLSTVNHTASLSFIFTSGNVTAIGGYFFPTDQPGNILSGAVALTLSDGTVINLTGQGLGTFTGYISSGAVITSLVMDTPDTAEVSQYPAVNNFYVGAAAADSGVPEPATTAMVGAGVLLLAFGLRKRRA